MSFGIIVSEQAKVVGKKSLLRTLQTLGSVPDWRSDEQQQQKTDSDGDSVGTPSQRKKKKKRKKRQKEFQETPEEEKIPPKKGKKSSNMGEQFTGLSLSYLGFGP